MCDYIFSVEGMMCEHCSMRLQKVLSAIDGVNSAQVSLKEKTARINAQEGLNDKLKEAIEDAGFEVTE